MTSSLVVADTNGMSNKAAERHVALLRKYESKKELLKEGMERTTSAVLAFATGLGVGYVEGRYPEKSEVLGVPLPMVIGAVGLVSSLFLPDEYAVYAIDIGNAGSAIYGRDLAYDLGQKKQQKAAGATAGTAPTTRAGYAAYPRAVNG